MPCCLVASLPRPGTDASPFYSQGPRYPGNSVQARGSRRRASPSRRRCSRFRRCSGLPARWARCASCTPGRVTLSLHALSSLSPSMPAQVGELHCTNTARIARVGPVRRRQRLGGELSQSSPPYCDAAPPPVSTPRLPTASRFPVAPLADDTTPADDTTVSDSFRRFPTVSKGFEGFQRFSKVSERFRRFPKVSDGVQRFPTISGGFQRCPTVSDSFRRSPKVSEGFPRFPKSPKF